MSRSGYTDDDSWEGAQWANIRHRGAVRSAIRGKKGQAFLKELLAALDALPEKRLVANVLQQGEWDEAGDRLVPAKDGDVCAFGAVGRARGIEMSMNWMLDDEADDWDVVHGVQRLFGTTESLSREIMYINDEGTIGRRVPIPNVRESHWDWFGYTYIPETPEERFIRVRKWVADRIWDWKEID